MRQRTFINSIQMQRILFCRNAVPLCGPATKFQTSIFFFVISRFRHLVPSVIYAYNNTLRICIALRQGSPSRGTCTSAGTSRENFPVSILHFYLDSIN